MERRWTEYPGHVIHGVLLSTSREGIDGEDEIAHVSWRDVGAQIETMHDADAFGQEEVAAFIRQYLVAVGRLIGPEDSDADYFRKLLDDHHSLLKHMFGVLGEEGGEQRVRAMAPERHARYQDTVVRLVKDCGQEPERWRSEVRDLLTSRGMKTKKTSSKGKVWRWLSWDPQGTQGKPWTNSWTRRIPTTLASTTTSGAWRFGPAWLPRRWRRKRNRPVLVVSLDARHLDGLEVGEWVLLRLETALHRLPKRILGSGATQA